MLARLHLVRHGEVHNPAGLVYAGLSGFPLSALGRIQASAAAEHLAASGVSVLVTSPLDRARETAAFVSLRLGLEAVIEPDLTEWGLSTRWAGQPWNDLDAVFPGEMAAYAADPSELPFSPESLSAVAARMLAVVERLGADHPGAIAAVVSHQDPIHALRLSLTRSTDPGATFAAFHTGKPTHASVITLEPAGTVWVETATWAPAVISQPFPPPTTNGQ